MKEKEFNLSEERKRLFQIFKTTGLTIDCFCEEILKQDEEAVKKLKELFVLNKLHDRADIYHKINEIFGDKLTK